MCEDQLDFHLFRYDSTKLLLGLTWCCSMSRMRLCYYVELLRTEDELERHGWYRQAALTAVQIYLKLSDGETDLAEAQLGQQPSSDIKKLKNKAKKEKARKEQENKNSRPQQKKNGKIIAEEQTSSKIEFKPEDLIATKDPLAEASKFLKPLLELFGNDIETQLAAFEINYRRRKPLLMVRALLKCRTIQATHPQLQAVTATFNTFISKTPNLDPHSLAVIEAANILKL